jgi:hypothetical protein
MATEMRDSIKRCLQVLRDQAAREPRKLVFVAPSDEIANMWREWYGTAVHIEVQRKLPKVAL